MGPVLSVPGLPAVASWILAAYLVGSLFCSFDQLSPSDDTLEPSFPQHHRAPIRPPPFSATSAFTTPPRRFHQTPPTPSRFSPAHGGATRCGFHPRYPLHLRTTPPPYRRPPRLPSPIVSFSGCPFLLLQSHLSSVGCYVQSVSWGGGGGGGLDVPTSPRVRGPPLSNVSVATLTPLSTVAILRCSWVADTHPPPPRHHHQHGQPHHR